MSKNIIVNADIAEEIRIAIIENGKLLDLDIETQIRAKHKGNIYKGIVSNIEDSLEAAFVDFGEEKQGFLPVSEIRPDIYSESLKNIKKIKPSDILVRGQEIVIQVTKDEIGSKGAAVSTYISLPGRYIVLMHSDGGRGGISRKIHSESARKLARDILASLTLPEGLAVIIRTIGISATEQELYQDFKKLCEIWEQINKNSQSNSAPTLLYGEPNIIIRTIRDYCSSDVLKIIIDNKREYEAIFKYFNDQLPNLVHILEYYRKKEPVFSYYGVEKEIEELFHRQVQLPSGGYIVIEQTEALVAIDVNSGKSTKEEDHEATVYKTNSEAAYEIARQLRLRDLGGIIIIDFIDMISTKHRKAVEVSLAEFTRSDKAKIKIGQISNNGILELTRQRLRQSHHLISHVVCENCHGTGRVRDISGLTILAFRNICAFLIKLKKKPNLSGLIIKLPVEVADQLNNQKRKELLELAEHYKIQLQVSGDSFFRDTQVQFTEQKIIQHSGAVSLSIVKSKFRSINNNRFRKLKVNNAPPQIGPAPMIDNACLSKKDNRESKNDEAVSQFYLQSINEFKRDSLMNAFFVPESG